MAVELGLDVAFPAGPQFGGEALRQLEQYAWPGNVRELKNVVERSVARRRTLHLDALDMDPFALPFNAFFLFEGFRRRRGAKGKQRRNIPGVSDRWSLDSDCPDAVAELERALCARLWSRPAFDNMTRLFCLD